MPTNIESFVKTLESEGVDAGKRAGEKIEAEARAKADTIIAEANETAERIIAEAQAEAEKVQARMNSSLELAARDAIYMLREKLGQQLGIMLKLNVEQALKNEETLAHVLREVIPAYAKSDVGSKLTAEINIIEGFECGKEGAVEWCAHPAWVDVRDQDADDDRAVAQSEEPRDHLAGRPAP